MTRRFLSVAVAGVFGVFFAGLLSGQDADGDQRPAAMRAALRALTTQPAATRPATRPFDFGGFPAGPGFGGPERKLVKEFDKDADGRLNRAERDTARSTMREERRNRRGFAFGPFGPGPGDGGPATRPATRASGPSTRPDVLAGGGFPPGFGRRGNLPPPRPGHRVFPSDVRTYPDSPLYETSVVRTFFVNFEDSDWESELTDFYHTDVEVPATVIVDGKTFRDVGVNFRGTTSFNAVQDGYKRSLKLKLDSVDKQQKLYGHDTINLNNANLDPGLMNSMLYSHISRRYIPTPCVNYAKVVINGEYWGVYVSAQQFDKEFLKEAFGSSKGERWKVPGNRFGDGAFTYLGNDIEEYKRIYEMKTGDDKVAWEALIELCRTLNQTPTTELETALEPMLDIEGALWFLAIDNVLINTDGYWSKGSDLNLFLDKKGKFHVVPHDTNESFQPPGFQGFGGPRGPGGFGGGPGGFGAPATRPGAATTRPSPDTRPFAQGFGGGAPRGFRMPRMPQVNGVELDPLVGMDDPEKPLRSRLLAVPRLREKYLQNVRTIAEQWLDWRRLGPIVDEYAALIEKDLEQDTKKLAPYEEFAMVVRGNTATTRPTTLPAERDRRPTPMSLRAFAEQRRKYLVNHPEIKKLSTEQPEQRASAESANGR